MRFSSERVAFGRHETFPLRFGWLPKGIQALHRDPKVFERDDSTVQLGVGRNMVNAIRYWLRAARMVGPSSYQITPLGKSLLSPTGFDPYLEDEGTIWLLHWLTVSNSELATSLFWFFNRFHKKEFSAEEMGTALNDFIEDSVTQGKRPSKKTVKSDASVILRMYSQSKVTQRIPLEDVLDSPFVSLRLIEHKSGEKVFVSRLGEAATLPIEIFGFALLEIMKAKERKQMPIEDLMYSLDEFPALGSSFRLTEAELIRKTELLATNYPQFLDIREDAGMHQIFLSLDETEPFELLDAYYGTSAKVDAA